MNHCDQCGETLCEIRKLPSGHGNLLLCYTHYVREIDFRLKKIKDGIPYNTSDWESLEVYTRKVITVNIDGVQQDMLEQIAKEYFVEYPGAQKTIDRLLQSLVSGHPYQGK